MKCEKPLFPDLEAELKRNGMKYKDYGLVIGTSEMGVSNRLRGITSFSYQEIIDTINHFKKEFKELFVKNNAQQ